MEQCGPTGNSLPCPRRLLPRNPHPTELMKTPLARPTCPHRLPAMPIGLFLLLSFLFAMPDSAQNDRPPWARKSKTAGSSTADRDESPDPLQDRAKIKVKVDLV